MIVKYPKAIKVLNNIITIDWNQKKCDDHQLKYGDKIFGYFEINDLEIVVSSGIPLSLQQETLLHEVLHSVFYFVNIAIDNPDEEQYLTIGSPILLATLTDDLNKEVFNFIFGG